MAVPDEYCGIHYRQISDTLRWRRGGKRMISRRPINEQNTAYTDSLEEPTLVSFQADDERLDVPTLLQQRAIAPWTPPKPARKKADEDEHPPGVTPGRVMEGD